MTLFSNKRDWVENSTRIQSTEPCPIIRTVVVCSTKFFRHCIYMQAKPIDYVSKMI
jgi:hypothetical protein